MNEQGYIIQIYPEGKTVKDCMRSACVLTSVWMTEKEPLGMLSIKGQGSLWVKKDPMARYSVEAQEGMLAYLKKEKKENER